MIISALPLRTSRSGSVEKASVSQITAAGWWKQPSWFFPARRFIAVLPPTEESTAASSVVGSWM